MYGSNVQTMPLSRRERKRKGKRKRKKKKKTCNCNCNLYSRLREMNVVIFGAFRKTGIKEEEEKKKEEETFLRIVPFISLRLNNYSIHSFLVSSGNIIKPKIFHVTQDLNQQTYLLYNRVVKKEE